VDLRGSSLMHRPPIAYPETAQAKGVRGTVSVEATLDANGNVTDAHVLSGPEGFRKTVLQSVLTWHFTPGAAESKQQVDIAFQPPPAGSQPAEGAATAEHDGKVYSFVVAPEGGEPRGIAIQRRSEKMLQGEEMLAERFRTQPDVAGRTLSLIELRGLSEATGNELLSRLPVHEGDVLVADSILIVRQVLRQFDEHLEFRVNPQGDGSYVFEIFPAGSAREPVMNRHEK
jgi:TonB family protein